MKELYVRVLEKSISAMESSMDFKKKLAAEYFAAFKH